MRLAKSIFSKIRGKNLDDDNSTTAFDNSEDITQGFESLGTEFDNVFRSLNVDRGRYESEDIDYFKEELKRQLEIFRAQGLWDGVFTDNIKRILSGRIPTEPKYFGEDATPENIAEVMANRRPLMEIGEVIREQMELGHEIPTEIYETFPIQRFDYSVLLARLDYLRIYLTDRELFFRMLNTGVTYLHATASTALPFILSGGLLSMDSQTDDSISGEGSGMSGMINMKVDSDGVSIVPIYDQQEISTYMPRSSEWSLERIESSIDFANKMIVEYEEKGVRREAPVIRQLENKISALNRISEEIQQAPDDIADLVRSNFPVVVMLRREVTRLPQLMHNSDIGDEIMIESHIDLDKISVVLVPEKYVAKVQAYMDSIYRNLLIPYGTSMLKPDIQVFPLESFPLRP